MDLTIITAAVVAAGFGALGTAKVMKARFMRARAHHVGFSAQSYQLIGGAELIGAAGVLTGLAYAPAGYASATGLLALLAGAALTHIRQGDGPAELAPAALFAAGTVCYLVALGVAR